jgi:NitT/TauT family transport system substrate-binding protein
VIFRSAKVTVKFPSFRWKMAFATALALAVPALAAGCSAANAGLAATPEKTAITVDIYPTIDFAGLYIAQMDGLFGKQGLNVNIIFTPASQLAVTSVVNGTSDIAGSDYVTYIDNELNDNARLRIAAEASSLQEHGLELLVGPHSPTRTLAGLKGHTIAVTSADDIDTLLLRALLAENDISPSAVNIEFGFQLLNISKQLDAGSASAAAVPEPFATEGEEQYGLQELADVDQGVTTNFPLEGYAVTQAWAHKYPRTLAAFDRALSQGQAIADTDHTAFQAAAEKYLGIKPVTAAVLNPPSFPLSVIPAQLQRVADTMVQFGMLPPRDASFKITTMTS